MPWDPFGLNPTSSTAGYGQIRDDLTAHAPTSCTHVWHIFHADATGRRAPPESNVRLEGAGAHTSSQALLAFVMMAICFSSTRTASIYEGWSSTGRATRREGCCTPAQMRIAIAGEAVRSCKPAAACLGPFGRTSEKDGGGSRFPRRGGDKSSPPSLIRGSPQGSSDGTLESFIGLRFGGARGCSNLCLTKQPAQRCSAQRRVMAGT